MHQGARAGGEPTSPHHGRAVMARKPKAGAGEPAPPEPEGKAPESAEERAFRMALALELMATPETKLAGARALFETLCRMVGDDKARAQWQAIAKRRRGRPAKSNEQRAAFLCAMFDAVAGDWLGREEPGNARKVTRDRIIKQQAAFLMEKQGGQSVDAIAQEIRRAIEARTPHPFGVKLERPRGRPRHGDLPSLKMTKISD